MLAFESYSKTSFEIIIKERARAFLFKKMALQVPRFILEGKLKQGDRSTFEKFIDDEKWLGECVQYGAKGSDEYNEKQAKIAKFQEAAQTMAIEKGLFRDYQRLHNFYDKISKAFQHGMDGKIHLGREVLESIKQPKEGLENTAYKEMLNYEPSTNNQLEPCKDKQGKEKYYEYGYPIAKEQPSKKIKGPVVPLITGPASDDYRKDLSFKTNCKKATVSNNQPKNWGSKIHKPLYFDDQSFTKAAAAGKHWNAGSPFDSFAASATGDPPNYGGNDWADYPAGKCKPWTGQWCSAAWEQCGSPACLLYKGLGAGAKSDGWNDDDNPHQKGFASNSNNISTVFNYAVEMLTNDCISAWWFLYMPDSHNPFPKVDVGGAVGTTWAFGTPYFILTGDYAGWDDNTFATDYQGSHAYQQLQYHVQLSMVKCRHAYTNTITKKYNEKKKKYEDAYAEFLKLSEEIGLDTLSFMGGLAANAVQGVAYDVCELYIFAAFILATNFMSGTNCPTDFPYSAAQIREIGVAKLREMIVDIFQDMVEKVMQTYSGANLANVRTIDQLQKVTNYNHDDFTKAVSQAFSDPVVAGENTMPLLSLSNLDAVGSANQAYMEEELSDYAYILDANLYQIVKPVK